MYPKAIQPFAITKLKILFIPAKFSGFFLFFNVPSRGRQALRETKHPVPKRDDLPIEISLFHLQL